MKYKSKLCYYGGKASIKVTKSEGRKIYIYIYRQIVLFMPKWEMRILGLVQTSKLICWRRNDDGRHSSNC